MKRIEFKILKYELIGLLILCNFGLYTIESVINKEFIGFFILQILIVLPIGFLWKWEQKEHSGVSPFKVKNGILTS